MAKAQVAVAPILPLTADLVSQPISFFHRSWPPATLVIAMLVTLAWTGLLGYGFFKLVQPAFF